MSRPPGGTRLSRPHGEGRACRVRAGRDALVASALGGTRLSRPRRASARFFKLRFFRRLSNVRPVFFEARRSRSLEKTEGTVCAPQIFGLTNAGGGKLICVFREGRALSRPRREGRACRVRMGRDALVASARKKENVNDETVDDVDGGTCRRPAAGGDGTSRGLHVDVPPQRRHGGDLQRLRGRRLPTPVGTPGHPRHARRQAGDEYRTGCVLQL